MEAVSTSTESHNGDDATQDGSNHVTRGMREKKGCLRERNLRYTYTEKCWYHSATKFSCYGATGARSRGCQCNPCIWFCMSRPVELLTVLGNLLTILCCIFCRLVFSSFSDSCFYFVSQRRTIMFCLLSVFCVVFAYT
jgi:hypothetical protein